MNDYWRPQPAGLVDGWPPQAKSHFRRTVIVVTVALWASNFAVPVSRDLLSEHGLTLNVMLMRVALITLGCGLCYLIHLAIRRLQSRSFGDRALAVAIMTPLVAAAFSGFNLIGQWLAAPERLDSVTGATLVYGVITCTWFFLAWSAFYLALSYSEEARMQERRAAAIQAHAQAAQLRALRFQINPHFLFNTLNSINALIVDKEAARAEQMVSRLADFFRSNLSADPLEDVRLADELAAQRLYLEIEQVRFPDLAVEIDVPDDLLGALVPSLIVQPLVENAVKHGVSRNPDPVHIRIRARSSDDWLMLEVEDDGCRSGGTPRSGAGIGLANVQERLLRRFGDCCWFEAGPREPTGFLVKFAMPLRLAGPSEAGR